RARKATITNDLNTAIKIYQSIPFDKISDKAIDDLTLTCSITKKLDVALEVCKNVIKVRPNDLTALCNICFIYNVKKDREKEAFYYGLAKSAFTESEDDCYAILDCAIEMRDNEFVILCVERVLKNKPDRAHLYYPYAIALANVGEYEKSYKYFNKLCKLFPYEDVYRYQANYILNVIREGYDKEGLLPFGYKQRLPKPIEEGYRQRVKELFDDLNKVNAPTKKAENQKILKWALYQEGIITTNNAVLILCTTSAKWAKQMLFEALTDYDLSGEVKEKIIYSLILSGYRGEFKVVAGGLYMAVKGGRIPFEDKPNGLLFVQGYAYALSKAVFFNVNDSKKLIKSANKVYEALYLDAKEINLEQREIAGLILRFANIKSVSNVAGDVFDLDKERYGRLSALVLGEKDD
ncbi:MAG: hypothetical protein IKZ38_02515, partial [Clostridia bacterium]|nr:hypothetical protein [Clostridia bacterium]